MPFGETRKSATVAKSGKERRRSSNRDVGVNVAEKTKGRSKNKRQKTRKRVNGTRRNSQVFEVRVY